MIWIILALTLGASITSIIHGVFMLFGSLSISGTAIPGLPSTMLAILPIISAIFALIGGIIAFNQSKWGALFLFIAMGLCAPARDTWLYGGLYFFAGLFCFFLRRKTRDSYEDDYEDYDEGGQEISDYNSAGDSQDFYYLEDPEPEIPAQAPAQTIEDEINSRPMQPNNEMPQLRRRMTKSCPECGDVVSRDALYCPTCGTKLFVSHAEPEVITIPAPKLNNSDNDEEIGEVNAKLFASDGVREDLNQEDLNAEIPASNINLNLNDGDEMVQSRMSSEDDVPNYRVAVKSRRPEVSGNGSRRVKNNAAATEAASSYTEFSKYANKGKKRRRSAGRKILSMLLLVSAVGGALYFLLGLRKLPPGDLPPMVRPEVLSNVNENENKANTPEAKTDTIAEPSEVVIAENVLPDFTPERTPKNGAIIGSNVNVRSDHTTNSSRVTRLSVGTRVEVIGTFNVPSGQYSGIWYNIRTGGKEGWVYGRYLQPLGSGIPSGYSNGLLKTFGSNKSQLIETLGQPRRSTSSSAEWSGLTATLRGEEITRLRLTGKDRELQNGLKAGMSQTALLQIMGYPSSVNNKTMNYNEGSKTGLSVQLDKNNSISSITVNELQ